MCAKPPKPPKPYAPPPVEPPKIDLGSGSANEDPRLAKRRGRNQLRTDLGLGLPEGTGTGLTIP